MAEIAEVSWWDLNVDCSLHLAPLTKEKVAPLARAFRSVRRSAQQLNHFIHSDAGHARSFQLINFIERELQQI